MHLGNRRFLNIKQRPFDLLGLAALIMFMVTLIPTRFTLDINRHDTYYLFSSANIFFLPPGALLFIWLVYLCTRKALFSIKLTWAHTVLTLALNTLLILFIRFGHLMPGARRYYAYSGISAHNAPDGGAAIYEVLFKALCWVQLLLLINIVAGLVKYKASKKNAAA